MTDINVLSIPKADNIEDVNINTFNKENGKPYFIDGTRLATKEYVDDNLTPPVVLLPATEVPLPNTNTGYVGVSNKYAREDHSHPTDDYDYLPLSGGTMSGSITLPVMQKLKFGNSASERNCMYYNDDGAITIDTRDSISGLNIVTGSGASNIAKYKGYEIAHVDYVDTKVTKAIDDVSTLIPNVNDIYNEVDKRISVNEELINEIAANVVDIYKVPDKWVDDFQNISYDDCQNFVGEWRKGSFFQHNNDVFTGVNVIIDTESSYIFSYGFLTTKNDKLFVYHVEVSCILPPSSEIWSVLVNPSYETYITQSDYDNLNSRITALENKNTVDGEVDGDISGVLSKPLELIIDNSLIITAENKDVNNATIKMRSVKDSIFADLHKIGLYDTGGVDNASFDGYTFTTAAVIVDDLTYNDTNDWDSLRIRIGKHVYIVGIMLSGNGERSNMWYKKLL